MDPLCDNPASRDRIKGSRRANRRSGNGRAQVFLEIAPEGALPSLRTRQGLSNLPVVTEWILNAPDAPTVVLIAHGPNHRGPRRDGSLERRVRIFDNQNHPDRTAPERLRAEVEMLGRLVGDPELGAVHGQSSHKLTFVVLDAEQLLGAECALVEVHCACASTSRK